MNVQNPLDQEQVPLHQWQKDILDERARLIEEGKAVFVEWEIAKKRIAERISKEGNRIAKAEAPNSESLQVRKGGLPPLNDR